ncbi:MAG: hypothetical protein CMK59_06245 [Proteobacteria bacterium]|nr:hypothetical protein [Pseudomonadota bacterium]
MSIQVSHLRDLSFEALVSKASSLGIDNAGNLRHSELILEVIRILFQKERVAQGSANISIDGLLEVLPDGFGFLRSPISEFAPSVEDIYVSPSQIRRFNLRTGDWVQGDARLPRDNERYLALLRISSVNDNHPEHEKGRLLFDSMSSAKDLPQLSISESCVKEWQDWISKNPQSNGESLILSIDGNVSVSDLLVDWGSQINADVLLAFIEGQEEEMLRLRRKGAQIYFSKMGENAGRHQQLIDIVGQKAQRLAEKGKDVVLFVDSLGTLARVARDYAEEQERSGVNSIGSNKVLELLGLSKVLDSGGSLSVLGVLRTTGRGVEQRVIDVLSSAKLKRVEIDATALVRGHRCPLSPLKQ